MRTPEQVKWDFVQQWLDKARKDLAAAEVLLKEVDGSRVVSGYLNNLAQEVSEKQAASKSRKEKNVRNQCSFREKFLSVLKVRIIDIPCRSARMAAEEL